MILRREFVKAIGLLPLVGGHPGDWFRGSNECCSTSIRELSEESLREAYGGLRC
jgi:hypothetical protein